MTGCVCGACMTVVKFHESNFNKLDSSSPPTFIFFECSFACVVVGKGGAYCCVFHGTAMTRSGGG